MVQLRHSEPSLHRQRPKECERYSIRRLTACGNDTPPHYLSCCARNAQEPIYNRIKYTLILIVHISNRHVVKGG